MSERMCKDCFFNRNMQCGITGDCTVGHECYATPADFAAVRRELSAVDPVTAALEQLARAYHAAAWEGDVLAPTEVVEAHDALIDAGWTGESESTP